MNENAVVDFDFEYWKNLIGKIKINKKQTHKFSFSESSNLQTEIICWNNCAIEKKRKREEKNGQFILYVFSQTN